MGSVDPALDGLRAALDGLDAAAAAEEIEPGSYLGIWTQALRSLGEAIHRVESARAERADALLTGTQAVLDKMLAAAEHGLEEQRLEVRKIDRHIRQSEVALASMQSETVGKLVGEVSAKLQDIMVVRQTAYKWTALAKLVGVLIAGAVVVVTLDRAVMWGVRSNSPETAFMRECRSTLKSDPATGRTYCRIEVRSP